MVHTRHVLFFGIFVRIYIFSKRAGRGRAGGCLHGCCRKVEQVAWRWRRCSDDPPGDKPPSGVFAFLFGRTLLFARKREDCLAFFEEQRCYCRKIVLYLVLLNTYHTRYLILVNWSTTVPDTGKFKPLHKYRRKRWWKSVTPLESPVAVQ